MRQEDFLARLKYYATRPLENSTFNLPTSIIGTTLDNLYIPLFAFHTGELVIHENKRVIVYEVVISASDSFRRYRNNNYQFGVYEPYLISNKSRSFHCGNERFQGHLGSVFHVDEDENVKPLFCLTLRREGFWKFTKTPSFKDLVLVVSREFLSNKKYSQLRTKLKLYLQNLELMQVPFLIVSDIATICFDTPLELPKFKTVNERVSYLSNLHNFIPKKEDEGKKDRLAAEAAAIDPPTTETEIDLITLAC